MKSIVQGWVGPVIFLGLICGLMSTLVWGGFTPKSQTASGQRKCCVTSNGAADIDCSQKKATQFVNTQANQINALPEYLRPQGTEALQSLMASIPKTITGQKTDQKGNTVVGSPVEVGICDQQLSTFQDLVGSKIEQISSFMSGTDLAKGLSVPAPSGDFLPYPDNQDLDFALPDRDLFVLLDGVKLVESGGIRRGLKSFGSGDTGLIRLWLADAVERMARLYVSGSAQLNRDFPGSYPEGVEGFLPVLGIYQGYRPNLISIVYSNADTGEAAASGSDAVCKASDTSKRKTEVDQRTKNAAWASCKSGIANAGNSKWFRNKAGVLAPETATNVLVSHECDGQAISPINAVFAQARGQVVEQIMLVMQKMQKGILEGKVFAASSYSGDTFTATDGKCPEARAQILEFRSQFLKKKKAYMKDNKGKNPADQCQGKNPDMAACYLNSLQTEIELQWVSRYAFCIFDSIADELIDVSLDVATGGGS